MNRLAAFVLLAVSLVLFGASVDAQAQTYTAPAGIPAKTSHALDGR